MTYNDVKEESNKGDGLSILSYAERKTIIQLSCQSQRPLTDALAEILMLYIIWMGSPKINIINVSYFIIENVIILPPLQKPWQMTHFKLSHCFQVVISYIVI